MQKVFPICLFLLLAGCDNASGPKEVSTVDSNFLDTDSAPPNINPEDSVVLDSLGPTIHPEDTNYNRNK